MGNGALLFNMESILGDGGSGALKLPANPPNDTRIEINNSAKICRESENGIGETPQEISVPISAKEKSKPTPGTHRRHANTTSKRPDVGDTETPFLPNRREEIDS